MQLRILPFFLSLGMLCFCTTTPQVLAYVDDSAHGSTTYGVDRLAGFAVANCAHCHEQHASVNGSEPPPVTNAKEYLLFDQSNTDQAANFCFDCHTSVSAYQQVTNRSYSYRAGGWNGGPVTNIKDAFGQASSHNLEDIVDFTVVKGWNLAAAKVNACAICHDPHVVQGDPPHQSNFKSLGTRGFAITEINTSPGNLWGDVAGEKMDFYAPPPAYQAPYRYPASPNFEPEGNGTSDGSNLPDYVTFCTKCHDDSNTLYSTNLGRDLKVIDWTATGDKHGKANGDVDIRMNLPYIQGAPPVLQAGGYVLSCLDCHEPHGSGNLSLLRGEVNGVQLLGNITLGTPQYELLCGQCHNPAGGASNWDDVHHLTDQAYLRAATCNSNAACHPEAAAPVTRINCLNCHFHGSVSGVDPITPVPKPLNLDTTVAPTGRGNF